MKWLRRLLGRGDDVGERLAAMAARRLEALRRAQRTSPGDPVIEREIRETERIMAAVKR